MSRFVLLSSVRVAPGESIAAAILASRVGTNNAPHEVVLDAGVHHIDATIALTGADSGLTLRGTGAVIDGGVVLPTFTVRGDGLWEAALPPALAVSKGGLSALYINGQQRLRARAPNAVGGPPWSFESLLGDAATFHLGSLLAPCSLPAFGVCPGVDTTGFVADLTEPGSPNASWPPLEGALVAVAQAWLFDWARVGHFNASSGELKFAAPLRDAVGAYGATRDSPSGGRWFVEDARGALDAPGEFFVDAATQSVLYVPLPGETPSTVTAVMPALKTLWTASGSKAAPASGITLSDVVLQNFGEGGADARLGYWAYTSAAQVGPYAANVTLRNVTVMHGVADAIGVLGNVAGVVLERLTVSDVGGRGVGPLGDLNAAERTVSGFVLANSTISRVGFVFLGGSCAVSPVGGGARVVHNALSDTPYSGVSFQGPGGPSRAEAPSLEVAFNVITDVGSGVLSDLGAVYISTASDKVKATNWIAADVHHNLILRARGYGAGYGANGCYADHGTSGVCCSSNIFADLGGRAGSLHCGNGLEFTSNLVYNVATQNFTSTRAANGALSACNGADVAAPGFSANVSGNIVVPLGTPNAWSLKDTTWAPPHATVTGDNNVWWGGAPAEAAGRGLVFPNSRTLAEWRTATGNDAHSVEADPLLRDPAHGDFTVLPGSPAWALGWVALDPSAWGPLPL